MALAAKGLEGIIANESKLSNVQGSEGKLCYLGYTIDDLVEHTSFEEVIYLLHNGKLPNQSELNNLTDSLKNRNLPDGIIDFLRGAPKDAGPMDVIRTAVSMLGLYDTKGTIKIVNLMNREPSQSLQRPLLLLLLFTVFVRVWKLLKLVKI